MNNKQLISSLIDEIENEVSGKVSINKLSDTVGLSPWHLQKVFKKAIGETLGKYIRNKNLVRSAKMLKETDFGILDIAIDSGYSSHEAFTRSFKCFYGMTPKEFRNNKGVVFND